MTINTEVRSVIYAGNGVTTQWPFTFRIPSLGEMRVRLRNMVTFEERDLAPSEFSATGFNVDAGGTVTYPLSGAPLASTWRILIERIVPLTQNVEIDQQSGFFPEVVERGLDSVVMQVQQVSDAASRSLSMSPFSQSRDVYIAELEPDRLLQADSNNPPKSIIPGPRFQDFVDIREDAEAAADASATYRDQSQAYSLQSLEHAEEAAHQVTLAAEQVTLAADQVTLAAGQADRASRQADRSEAAAEASGDVRFFDTYADANAALPGLSDQQIVRVFADETRKNSQVFYRVEGGVLVEKFDVDLFTPNFISSERVSRVAMHERFITPDMFGDVGGTDNTLAILRARDAALASNSVLIIPRGVWNISQTLELNTGVSLSIHPGARLRAMSGFTGEALVRVGDVGDMADNVLIDGGGAIDADNNVDMGLDFFCARFSRAINLDIIGANLRGFRVGSPDAGTPEAGELRSYEVDAQNIRTFYNDIPNANDSIGFLWEHASDCYFSQGQSIGYRKGFSTLGGSIEISQAHPWVRPVHAGMSHAFEIMGSSNVLSQCYADTPTNFGNPSLTDLYGFYIAGYGVILQGCRAFMNNNHPQGNLGTDGLIDVIYYPEERVGSIFGFRATGATTTTRFRNYVAGATESLTALGLWDEGSNRFVNPDSRGDRFSDRIPLTFRDTALFKDQVDFDNNANFRGNFVSVANALAVRGPAGQVRDVLLQTDTSTRWSLRASQGAETGGDVGSIFQLNAYSDNGSFKSTVFSADRATSRVTFNNPPNAPGFQPSSYTVANIPAANTMPSGTIVRVSNGFGGLACLAVSDGVNWYPIPIQMTQPISTTDRGVAVSDAFRPRTYTSAALPDPAVLGGGAVIRVSDGWGGTACLAMSNGSLWTAIPPAEVGPNTLRSEFYADVVQVGSYTVANAPVAGGQGAGALIRVSNGDSGAACLAISDGANWRRIPMGAIISAS